MDGLLPESQAPAVATAVELGISRGRELLRWWNAQASPPLEDLQAGNLAGGRCWSFFSEMQLNGKPMSLMGCLQQCSFKPPAADPGSAVESLREWLNANFLRASRWSRRGELPGGFLYRPILVKESGAPAARTVPAETNINLADIGPSYDWAAVRLDVLDYMKAFRRIGRYDRWLRRFNKESGYMVFHPAFFRAGRPAPAGCFEETCFGYAVAPWTVIPTFVAYGPGRFYGAVKQYRFFFDNEGTLTIQVTFLVAPRTEKVLSFRGWDPFYGTVGLLDLLTLRRTSMRRRAHDRIDRYGLGHHARVHYNLLDGMRPIWEGTRWRISSEAAAPPTAYPEPRPR